MAAVIIPAPVALVMADNGGLAGVITDGDLRRFLVDHDNLKGLLALDLMNTTPVTISQEAMVADAEQLMREDHLKWVIALNDDHQVAGLLEGVD
ncbi:CBS domain-containing protein [Endozoicomonas sp.]|uniref:CBS domain-containing protein n=1 Tax=Endozoicomonas sp. TaxID=1892382 RepID=UPI00383A393C